MFEAKTSGFRQVFDVIKRADRPARPLFTFVVDACFLEACAQQIKQVKTVISGLLHMALIAPHSMQHMARIPYSIWPASHTAYGLHPIQHMARIPYSSQATIAAMVCMVTSLPYGTF